MPALSTTPPLVVYVVRKSESRNRQPKTSGDSMAVSRCRDCRQQGCMLLQKFRQRSAELDRNPRLGGCANQRPVEETIHPRL